MILSDPRVKESDQGSCLCQTWQVNAGGIAAMVEFVNDARGNCRNLPGFTQNLRRSYQRLWKHHCVPQSRGAV